MVGAISSRSPCAIGQLGLQAQAGLLAHVVAVAGVVQAPVGQPPAGLALHQRVTELVQHQLRQAVVGVQRLGRADRDGAAAVGASRRPRRAALDLEPAASGGVLPRADRCRRGRAAQRGASRSFGRGIYEIFGFGQLKRVRRDVRRGGRLIDASDCSRTWVLRTDRTTSWLSTSDVTRPGGPASAAPRRPPSRRRRCVRRRARLAAGRPSAAGRAGAAAIALPPTPPRPRARRRRAARDRAEPAWRHLCARSRTRSAGARPPGRRRTCQRIADAVLAAAARVRAVARADPGGDAQRERPRREGAPSPTTATAWSTPRTAGLMGIRCVFDDRGRCDNGHVRGMSFRAVMDPVKNVELGARELAYFRDKGGVEQQVVRERNARAASWSSAPSTCAASTADHAYWAHYNHGSFYITRGYARHYPHRVAVLYHAPVAQCWAARARARASGPITMRDPGRRPRTSTGRSRPAIACCTDKIWRVGGRCPDAARSPRSRLTDRASASEASWRRSACPSTRLAGDDTLIRGCRWQPPRSSASQPVAGEDDLVRLDPDHPGFRDAGLPRPAQPDARIALAYKPGEPVPRIEYTEEEHAVWRAVWEKLAPVHDRHACRAYREARDRLALDQQRIPQLADVNPALKARTGFQMVPVAGLVTSRAVPGAAGPGHVPVHPVHPPRQPPAVHARAGRGARADRPRRQPVRSRAGAPEPAVRAAAASASDADITVLERLYWYTLEFGLVEEDGRPARLRVGPAVLVRRAGPLRDRGVRQAVRSRRGGGPPLRSHRLPGGAVRGPQPGGAAANADRLAGPGRVKVGAK